MNIKSKVIFLLLSLFTLPLQATSLMGGGASFPAPFYQNSIKNIQSERPIQIQYLSSSSSKGFIALKNKQLHFAGTDMFINKRLENKTNQEFIHIPTCLSALVITFNLPGIKTLNLDSESLAKIYLGQIKFWNHPQIQNQNPHTRLPKIRIVPIHREGGSGSTYILSEYLSKTHSQWAQKMGKNGKHRWPSGISAKGSDSMKDHVKQITGSIAYMAKNFAEEGELSIAALKNQSNNYIYPSLASISSAADIPIPSDTKIYCTNTSHPDGYPLASFSWIILSKDLASQQISKQNLNDLKFFLQWLVTSGQTYAEALNYAPLPEEAVQMALKQIKRIK